MRYLIIFFMLVTPAISSYADQDTEDVLASVVILPTFEIDIDNNYLDFGLVNPGQSVTLKEGTYYNTAGCVSNKGIKYYVKINIMDDVIGPEGVKIPSASFKWRVYRTNGKGIALSNWQEFSNKPVLAYTSDTEDETGNEVIIRFQYRLDLPGRAMAGYYSLRVAYVLTEEE